MNAIVWYVSGHGFGHASPRHRGHQRHPGPPSRPPGHRQDGRQAVDLRPDAPVRRWTSRPSSATPASRRSTACGWTRPRRCGGPRRFYATFDERVPAEAAFLNAQAAALVVGDIPPLAFAAAHEPPACRRSRSATSPGTGSTRATNPRRMGRPNLVPLIREATAQASASSCACRCGAASRWRRPSGRATSRSLRESPSARPAETRRALGLPADKRLVLLSFGGHGLKDLSPDAFAALRRRLRRGR